MSAENDQISKFIVRFRGVSDPQSSELDDLVMAHLNGLKSIGGHQEWMRNAIRNQYLHERAARESLSGGKK